MFWNKTLASGTHGHVHSRSRNGRSRSVGGGGILSGSGTDSRTGSDGSFDFRLALKSFRSRYAQCACTCIQNPTAEPMSTDAESVNRTPNLLSGP